MGVKYLATRLDCIYFSPRPRGEWRSSPLRTYGPTHRCFAVDQPSHRAEGSKTMAKRRTRPARHTIFTPGELAAHHRDMPKRRHGHPFAPDRGRIGPRFSITWAMSCTTTEKAQTTGRSFTSLISTITPRS